VPEQKTRRRGDALEDAILKAAWQELTRHGYQDLSMEAVAARAGTSKTVLYRRWRTRAELALATMRRHASVPPLRPDAGRLRDDVVAILRWLSERYRSFPDVVQGLMIELPDAEQDVSQTSVLALDTALAAASNRGEIVADGLLPRLRRLPVDLAQHEMFVTRQPLSDQQIDEIVDDVFLPLVTRRSRPKK
jgi:AcrR family transcriptional regulator